jgi:hypothetical protein
LEITEIAPGSNRNLVCACQELYNRWLPVDDNTLSLIKDGLAAGVYDLNPDFFFEALKTDLGLFTYFLREARRKIQKKRGCSTPLNLNPTEMYLELNQIELCAIFDIKPKDISPYSLKGISDERSKRLRQTIITASTSEALAKAADIDEISGYSTGTLSQIGKAMIAWNFPELFKAAENEATDEASLDHLLTLRLGFSPKLLVIALARDWGLSVDIRAALGDELARHEISDPKVSKTVTLLQTICEVGQVVARAADNSLEKVTDTEWTQVVQIIESIIGPDGIDVINKQIKDNCYTYLKVAPDIFQYIIDENIKENPQANIPNINEFDYILSLNRHLKVLPKEAQAALKTIYRQVSDRSKNKVEIVRELMKNVAPLSGMPQGCIYILDPDSLLLTPRLIIGQYMHGAYRPVHTNAISTRTVNPIGAAYNCTAPVIHNDFSLSAISPLCLSGVIGKKQRVGVLYLEPELELAENPDSNLLYRFKAILLAFEYALGVS